MKANYTRRQFNKTKGQRWIHTVYHAMKWKSYANPEIAVIQKLTKSVQVALRLQGSGGTKLFINPLS